ncbi:MAG: hypothetical protein FWF46_03175 [Oscillospiraceae bacterium]|nr:hypothetical protein [Oscillospiraceae bacterium]
MKVNKILKLMIIILVLAIIIMVSFVGIFIQNKNILANIVKDYKFGMDFGEQQETVLSPSTATVTNYYDKDGKLVDSSTVTDSNKSDYTSKDEPVNSAAVLTLDNYKKAEEIINKRLENFQLSEYTISLDEATGNIIIKTSEDDDINTIISGVYSQGEFLIKDATTGDVLLNNSDIKNATVSYVNGSSSTSVYLNIQMNKEGTQKLEQISQEYVQTTKTDENGQPVLDSNGEQTTDSKNVQLYIDGTLVTTTYFGQTISNGTLQLSITPSGGVTTQSDLQQYLLSGDVQAKELSYGNLPLIYSVNQSVMVSSDVFENILPIAIIVSIIILTLMLIYLVIRHKERGIISTVLLVGFVALLLLAIRYGNVYITVGSTFVIAFITIFYFVFLDRLLTKFKTLNAKEVTPKSMVNKTILKSLFILIPMAIIVGVSIFFTNIGINGFGTTLFWGIAVFIVYVYVFTKTLLLNFEYLFEE